MLHLKRFRLRIYISVKYITAHVVEQGCNRILASASTVEEAVHRGLRCGPVSGVNGAAVVGEVLAMRLKVVGIQKGLGGWIHVDEKKEIETRDLDPALVSVIIKSLKSSGVKVVNNDDNADDENRHGPRS